MPSSVERFLCSICGSEHVTYDHAVQCEMLPDASEPQVFEIGDIITYEDEVAMGCSRYAYDTKSGVILSKEKRLLCLPGGIPTAHATCYVVDDKYTHNVVCFVDDGFGVKLASLASWKRSKGF